VSSPVRVVFDCNVYFQAVISLTGPARCLLQLAVDGKATLFASEYVMAELAALTADPRIKKKYQLSDDELKEFFSAIRRHATFLEHVPAVFELARDPKDAHYVDLALAVSAKLIVSRDKDLLSLRDLSTNEGQEFAARFPHLEILTPPEALHRVHGSAAA
jgi:putative PIN family toxin of toxin-antitoxin system